MASSPEETDIGIVLIGRNEGERLRQCFESLPQKIPIVYVDSASTDDSVELARRYEAEVVELDPGRPFTAARARNEGLAHLLERYPRTRMVQFIDGDCQLEKGWLTAAATFLGENSRAAAVCGRRRERYPSASFYNRICDEEWATPVGCTQACGGDVMIRVTSMRSAGCYDEALIAGEEPELCARLRDSGWTIWRLDEPMTIHDAAIFHFTQWWRRAIRSGYGYAQVWHKTVRQQAEPLYGRELARATGWSLGVVALVAMATSVFGETGLLLAPGLWTLQFGRLSFRYGARKASLLFLGKFAEFFGAVRYGLTAFRRGRSRAIFYK